MTPAPLQLLDYWATSIRMDACQDYDPAEKTVRDFDSISVTHAVKPLESPEPEKKGTKWLVGLSIEQKPLPDANLPYTFAVSLQGLVAATPSLKGEQLDRVIKANGPAMLFGAAREMIRAATGRGPHNAVIIPSTNFLTPAKPAAEEKPAAAKGEAGKAKTVGTTSAKAKATKKPVAKTASTKKRSVARKAERKLS